MIAKPIADKLALRSEEEVLIQSMVIDATLAIAKNQNSYMLNQTLLSYLPSAKKPSSGSEAA